MLRVLVACANGAGTSLMMKMRVEKACKDLGIKVANIHHCSLSEGKSAATQYDVVFCPLTFKSMFADAEKKGVKICGMKNVLSDQEAQVLLKEAGFAE